MRAVLKLWDRKEQLYVLWPNVDGHYLLDMGPL